MKKMIVSVILALATWGLYALGNVCVQPGDNQLGFLILMFMPIIFWMCLAEWWWEIVITKER